MKWIKVNDRLPEAGIHVLILIKGLNYTTGAYIPPDLPKWFVIIDYDEYDQHIRIEDVSHWMPVPELPKNI